jgi:hypothetical protein
MEALIVIDETDTSSNGSTASSLLNSVATFSFKFMVSVLTDVFQMTNILSLSLQEKEVDYNTARNLIKSTIDQLNEKVVNELHFETYWNETANFCKENDISMPILSRRRRVNQFVSFLFYLIFMFILRSFINSIS